MIIKTNKSMNSFYFLVWKRVHSTVTEPTICYIFSTSQAAFSQSIKHSTWQPSAKLCLIFIKVALEIGRVLCKVLKSANLQTYDTAEFIPMRFHTTNSTRQMTQLALPFAMSSSVISSKTLHLIWVSSIQFIAPTSASRFYSLKVLFGTCES